MNSFAEEKVPDQETRSIKIRDKCKPLIEYYEILNKTDKSFPHQDVDMIDDIFRSFAKENNYDICLAMLQLLFEKNGIYSWDKVKRKISFNIGRTLDYFFTKFKTNITEDDLKKLPDVIQTLASGMPLDLRNLKDTDYVMAVLYFKHYNPDLYIREKDEILRRLYNDDTIDTCVKSFAHYMNEQINDLIYFECHSFVLIRNTNIITEQYIKDTMTKLLGGIYRENWITIFANKMLATLIVPIIAYKETHPNEILIDDALILEWLMSFSERALGRKLDGYEDKLESINDEEFALTWGYVKKHASPQQRKDFQKYLIENGFEFHMSDPFSGVCIPNANIN